MVKTILATMTVADIGEALKGIAFIVLCLFLLIVFLELARQLFIAGGRWVDRSNITHVILFPFTHYRQWRRRVRTEKEDKIIEHEFRANREE